MSACLGLAKEEFYGRSIILADRDMVEQSSDEILNQADTEDIALLVVGDPFGATTHTDFVLRAHEKGIPYKVIHNASIMNAVGCCGLQLYNFGETVSIPFWTDTWQPDSFYEKIAKNRSIGLHTLCLLDIKVKEQSIENLMKGRKVYEPPRYMSVSQAAQQLLSIVAKRTEENLELAFDDTTLCVGLARVGCEDQAIRVGSLRKLCDCTVTGGSADLGPPLHSLVITGPHTHPIERDMLRQFVVDESVLSLLDEANAK